MKFVLAVTAAVVMGASLVIVPTVASASGWNQKAYNNSQAAQRSQQHYNQQTGRR